MPKNPVALLLLAPLLLSAESGSHVQYIGGTVYPKACDGIVLTTSQDYLEFQTKSGPLRVEYSRINLVEYGQKVDRRYAMAVFISPMFLLSKKRAHFVTVGYTDGDGRQQALLFRVDKNHVRSLLVSLEARTGRKVQFQDDEARKAGKG